MELHPTTKKRMEGQPLLLQDFLFELQDQLPKNQKLCVWTYEGQEKGQMKIHVLHYPQTRISAEKEIKKALENCPKIERIGKDFFRVKKTKRTKKAD